MADQRTIIAMKTTDITLPAALAARFVELPPTLSIPQVADFFKKKTPTLRKQIDRGTFPVTVRQIEGGEQYVLLADLMRFTADGIPQPQAPLVKRETRNPFGRLGKRPRGRPTKLEQFQNQKAQAQS